MLETVVPVARLMLSEVVRQTPLKLKITVSVFAGAVAFVTRSFGRIVIVPPSQSAGAFQSNIKSCGVELENSLACSARVYSKQVVEAVDHVAVAVFVSVNVAVVADALK